MEDENEGIFIIRTSVNLVSDQSEMVESETIKSLLNEGWIMYNVVKDLSTGNVQLHFKRQFP